MSDRGPRNSSCQWARCTPVVGLSLEHHTGVAFLGFWTVKTVLNPISGQVFDGGHGDSGVLHSARWHDDDWAIIMYNHLVQELCFIIIPKRARLRKVFGFIPTVQAGDDYVNVVLIG
ncbi:hypothetical protein TNCV_2247221 [Trichonephila clavipes]|nr:hypothetical protein TNCV_2247221 [Trichonephila clavipes]